MKNIILFFTLAITGCSTVPLEQSNFVEPEVKLIKVFGTNNCYTLVGYNKGGITCDW